MTTKPTIYDIKRNQETPYFSRETLKFFNQTLKDFKVHRTTDPTVFKTTANSYWDGRLMGVSTAFWRLENEKYVKVERPGNGE